MDGEDRPKCHNQPPFALLVKTGTSKSPDGNTRLEKSSLHFMLYPGTLIPLFVSVVVDKHHDNVLIKTLETHRRNFEELMKWAHSLCGPDA